MQVSVEAPGGLERRMRVSIPSQQYEQAVSKQLAEIAKVARVDGFRPGKVPTRVLRQRYGARARQDALSELLESSYPEALQEADLSPAGQPQIEFENIDVDGDVTYVATFDVFPEIEVQGLSGMAVKDPLVEVTAADIDKVIERLRDQRKTFAEKTDAAADGDKVTIDFAGTIDGEAFDGGSSEDMQVTLGEGRFLKELEDGIVGMKAGENKTVPVTFPDDYHAEDLQGKTADFAVTLKQVETPELPEIDDAFCEQFGVNEGGVEALREKLTESLEKERQAGCARYRKTQVLENILEANPIDVPKALVAQEIDRMRQEAMQRFGQGGQKSSDELQKLMPDELFEEQAQKRTALGLLIGEIIKAQEIKVDDAQVDAKLTEMAADYEESEAAIQYYRSNPQFMQSLRAMVLEDQVVQYCLDQATKTPENLSFDELVEKAPAQ